jgi:endoglucanase
MRRVLFALLAAVGCQLALAAVASASVQLTSTTYTASEKQGHITIGVERTDPLNGGDEYVHYATRNLDSTPGVDYDNVRGTIHMLPGQTFATFRIPIVPHDWIGPPAHVAVEVFSSRASHLGDPSTAILAINHDARRATRDPHNLLDLNRAPADGNPLRGARFYVDRWGSPAGKAELGQSNPAWASAISVIAREPWADRFGAWNGADPSQAVFDYLKTAYMTDPSAVPLLATYRVVGNQCEQGGVGDSSSSVDAYKQFVDGLSYGIGNFRAALFLEMDSLITSPCLKPQALKVRLSELNYAITTLERNNPHLAIYVDAGAADALRWQDAARLLNQAGVHQAQGFFLNSTHFDWTTTEIAYGQRIAKALGGVHFVVNTGENGQGPLSPRDITHQGNEVLCNPPGRGLGPKATTNTGYLWVDAFAWTSNPGESGGPCRPGAPGTGVYWPEYAVGLVRHANFNLTGPGRSRLLRGSGNIRAHSFARGRHATRRAPARRGSR